MKCDADTANSIMLVGKYFKSVDELKHAITTIVASEMGNRLKEYLAT